MSNLARIANVSTSRSRQTCWYIANEVTQVLFLQQTFSTSRGIGLQTEQSHHSGVPASRSGPGSVESLISAWMFLAYCKLPLPWLRSLRRIWSFSSVARVSIKSWPKRQETYDTVYEKNVSLARSNYFSHQTLSEPEPSNFDIAPLQKYYRKSPWNKRKRPWLHSI